jgi:hypothetical protein
MGKARISKPLLALVKLPDFQSYVLSAEFRRISVSASAI